MGPLRLGIAVSLALATEARPGYQSKIPNGANVVMDGTSWPGVGHVARAGGGTRNDFGLAFAAAGLTWTNALCQADTDGDGETNGEELGDPACSWSEGDANPTKTSGTISHPGFASSNSLTNAPTGATAAPTTTPSVSPTAATNAPTKSPSVSPTAANAPTVGPTAATNAPTVGPTAATNAPTKSPSASPTAATNAPTVGPTAATNAPSVSPSASPTSSPTVSPTGKPVTSAEALAAVQTLVTAGTTFTAVSSGTQHTIQGGEAVTTANGEVELTITISGLVDNFNSDTTARDAIINAYAAQLGVAASRVIFVSVRGGSVILVVRITNPAVVPLPVVPVPTTSDDGVEAWVIAVPVVVGVLVIVAVVLIVVYCCCKDGEKEEDGEKEKDGEKEAESAPYPEKAEEP